MDIISFEFRKFRILEILNFHPCIYTQRPPLNGHAEVSSRSELSSTIILCV